MDPAEHSLKEVERNFMTRTMKGAAVGLVPGLLWGTLAAAVQVEPPVGRAVVFPGMVPTLKIIGSKCLLFAGFGGLWVGVKVLVESYRMKRYVVNDAAGELVAGTVFTGLRNKSAFMAIYGGIAIANIPVVIDNVRRTLKILKTLKSKYYLGTCNVN